MSIALVLRNSAVALATAFLLGSAPAGAAVLYTNGDFPNNANTNAWLINYGYAVASSFDLSSNSTLTGADIGLWASPGDALTSIDWAIASLPDGTGTSYGSGTASITNVLDDGLNTVGYDLQWDSFSLPGLALATGSYWLILQNASVNGVDPSAGDSIFWDQGGGASSAWENPLGYLTADNGCGLDDQTAVTNGSCGMSFDITGVTGVPEPLTLSLFGAGLAGAVAMRRRRKTAA